MRLYLAVPSCRDWKPQFGASLCGLVRKLSLDGLDFNLHCMIGTSVLPKARQMAVENAIETGYTHILFLDDDMEFTPEIFEALSSHNKEIMAANYSNKNPVESKPQVHDLDGKPVYSRHKNGIQEVGWVGFGAILIELAIMKNVPKPWFQMIWHSPRNEFIGEDYFFCGQVRNSGYKIFINHNIEIAHIGDKAYTESTELIYDYRKEVA